MINSIYFMYGLEKYNDTSSLFNSTLQEVVSIVLSE